MVICSAGGALHGCPRAGSFSLLGLIAATFAFGTLVAEASAFDLMVSKSADRSNAVLLQGQTVDGNIYVFTSPATGTTQVRFYLDDPARVRTPIKTEKLGAVGLRRHRQQHGQDSPSL